MNIEVWQEGDIYLKAVINSVNEEGIRVIYENTYMPAEKVLFKQCRAFLDDGEELSTASKYYKIGDPIEVYIESKGKLAWHNVIITDIHKDVLIIESDKKNSNNCAVVPLENCRPANKTTQLSFDIYQIFSLLISEDMVDYFSNTSSFKIFWDVVPNVQIKLARDPLRLVFSTFSVKAFEKAKLLREAFLSYSKTHKATLEQKAELESAKFDNPGKITENFVIPDALMGLAIGKKGVNILEARSIDGVEDIITDKSHQEKTGTVSFKIIAHNKETAIKARSHLEYIYGAVEIPKQFVGQMMGKQGKNMQEIVNQANCIRVTVSTAEIGEENCKNVQFIFVGTREAIKKARLLVALRLNHQKEQDELYAKINKLRREQQNLQEGLPAYSKNFVDHRLRLEPFYTNNNYEGGRDYGGRRRRRSDHS